MITAEMAGHGDRELYDGFVAVELEKARAAFIRAYNGIAEQQGRTVPAGAAAARWNERLRKAVADGKVQKTNHGQTEYIVRTVEQQDTM